MINEITSAAINCLQDEAQAILDLTHSIDATFEEVVDLIYNCTGKFIITGVGKSGHIGAKIAATLASTGTPSFFVNPLDAYHGDLGMFSDNDVVLAISHSGYTDELLRFIPYLLKRDIPIIAMTGDPDSLLAKSAKYHINIAIKKEACPLNLVPTSSTTATLAMGDALACALMKKRNFKTSDFAQYHPGGVLGKKLLAKVKDYMQRDNLPIVSKEEKVCNAIFKISQAKLGIATVLSSDKSIEGVITDGDVRRAMQFKQDNFFELTVADIMTKNPVMISQDARLSAAENLLRKYNINSLIVVDEDENFVGVIDTFSCL